MKPCPPHTLIMMFWRYLFKKVSFELKKPTVIIKKKSKPLVVDDLTDLVFIKFRITMTILIAVIKEPESEDRPASVYHTMIQISMAGFFRLERNPKFIKM